jgi:hypothetical protein
MAYSNEQIDELKATFLSDVKVYHEGGIDYLYIPALKMPKGCIPSETDVLFCPVPHTGYQSRLFFKDRIEHPSQQPGRPNWQPTQLILGQNWHNFSFQGVTLDKFSSMVLNHLRGLYTV